MKGPYERLKYDLRRLWECPQCNRRQRSSGEVTAKFCTCGAGESGLTRHSMKLLEEAGHRNTPIVVLIHPPLEPMASPTPVAEELAIGPEAIASEVAVLQDSAPNLPEEEVSSDDPTGSTTDTDLA